MSTAEEGLDAEKEIERLENELAGEEDAEAKQARAGPYNDAPSRMRRKLHSQISTPTQVLPQGSDLRAQVAVETNLLIASQRNPITDHNN